MTAGVATKMVVLKLPVTKEIVDIAMNCVDQKNKAEILFTNIDVYGADDLPRKFNELGGQYADLVDRTKRHEVLLQRLKNITCWLNIWRRLDISQVRKKKQKLNLILL